MSEAPFLLGAALFGALIVLLFVPAIAKVCHRRGWLDQPGPRKIHIHPTPRLPGVALFAAIWLPVILASLLWPGRLIEVVEQLPLILTGAMVILALGIYDDLHPVRGWIKLLIQLAVGTVLCFSGVGFDRVWIPFIGGFHLGGLAFPVTLLWYLMLQNAINIIDGIDGLAVSTTAIATLTIIWVSVIHHLSMIGLGAAGLLGGLLVFWRFNRTPAQVFMGDSGSLSLGYFFAVVALLAPIKRFTVLAFFVPVFAMFVPLMESVFSLLRRAASGSNPLHPDREHLHHHLLRIGWPTQRIVAVYAGVTAQFGVFSVLMDFVNRRWIAVGLGIFVLALIGGLGIIFRRATRFSDQSSGGKESRR